MSLAYRMWRSWDARSRLERTALLVVAACLLYVAITLTFAAGEGLP
jgi:hypothetical protein